MSKASPSPKRRNLNQTAVLAKLILEALDCAIANSEWGVAENLLCAMESLFKRDKGNYLLATAYMRLIDVSPNNKH